MNRRTQVLLETLDKYLTESTTMKVIEIIAESRLDEGPKDLLTIGKWVEELWPIAREAGKKAGAKTAEFWTDTAWPTTKLGWRVLMRTVKGTSETEQKFIADQGALLAKDLKEFAKNPAKFNGVKPTAESSIDKVMKTKSNNSIGIEALEAELRDGDMLRRVEAEANQILKTERLAPEVAAAEKAAAEAKAAEKQAEAEKKLTQQQRDAKRAEERALARTDAEKAAQRKHELALKKAEEKIEKAKANTTHTSTNTTNTIQQSLGTTSSTMLANLGGWKKWWLGANALIAGSTLFSIFDTYDKNMDYARKGLAQGQTFFDDLKEQGQLAGMTINGQEPQNVEEWFVLFNHNQAELTAAKMAEIGTLAVLGSAVSFGLLRFVSSGIAGTAGVLSGPLAYNAWLAYLANEDDPWKYFQGVILDHMIARDATTFLADIYQNRQIPDGSESKRKVADIINKIRSGYKADDKKSQEKDNVTPTLDNGEEVVPGTATNQGAKVPDGEQSTEPAVGTTPGGATVSGDWK